MYRLNLNIILCFILFVCCQGNNPDNLEDYLTNTRVSRNFDSIMKIEDNIIYYQHGCCLIYSKVFYKSNQIKHIFRREYGKDISVNYKSVLLDSTITQNQFNYQLYDYLNGYKYCKGLIRNDSLMIVRIVSKDKKCDLYKAGVDLTFR
jgi:translation initiation factor 2 beta subunit (eIF-2beta)/eIF-5